ncbi:hypothetical protein MNBD_GAMMA06-1774, partial [hydrothermal vent metagenome]
SAELTANAGIFSNYMFRGVSQTNEGAAAQGGIDWGHDSGLYVGTWTSNVAFPDDEANTLNGALGTGTELDFYAGFAGEAGAIGYDVGIIAYQYLHAPEINFTEVYGSGTMSIATVGFAYTVDSASGNEGGIASGDLYLSGSIDLTLGKSDVSLYAGTYMFDNDGVDDADLNYNHFGASIGKDGFALAVDKTDIDDARADNLRVTVSYAVDFEL